MNRTSFASVRCTFARPLGGLVLALAAAIGLSACGDDAAVASVSGTAAVGQPLANASVSMQCVIGEALTTTTSASGGFSLSLTGGQQFPCFVTVTGGTPAVTLHSVAQAEGYVNVTPLTDLAIAAAAGSSPAAWFAANRATLATALPTLVARLPAGQAAVTATLAASGYTVPTGNLFTTRFTPADGDAFDDLLEAIKTSLADAGRSYESLVSSVAASGTATTVIPFTDVITSAEVAAMPQLNSATLSIADGVLAMRTAASGPAAVGAYVGSGTGNKAVLQLPGLEGMKLKDLREVSVELKPVTPFDLPNPYVSLNLMVDLHCDRTPLAANATLADVRARHRVITFDSYYRFINDEPTFFSNAQFSAMTFTPATGGWRISAGAVAGNDTGVEEVDHGSQFTLQGFDYATYPDACIVSGISGDGGLFRDKTADPACDTADALADSAPATCGKAHAGAFLFLGSSGNLLAGDWQIRKVRVNERTFTFR
jgi:hypothetical protein